MARIRQPFVLNRLVIRLAISTCLLITSSKALDNDFSFYPANAQPCLYQAATRAQCQGSNSQELNGCLCGNGGGFITNAAQCLGTNDGADVASVYRTMAQACADSHTPMSVSQSDFFALANGRGRKTKTSAASTTTATIESENSRPITTEATVTVTSIQPAASATPTEGQEVQSKPTRRLTTGARIGIGVGVAVGGVAAVAVLSFLLFQHRRRKAAKEAATAMLPPSFNHGDQYRHENGAFKTPPAAAVTTDAKHGWNQDQVYEMDGTGLPAQMHGSESEHPPALRYPGR